MIISLIAAVSENWVIGKDGIIPWKIPGEQTRFKELTLGKTIIMGRNTYEEIGRPLPGRKTIIISTTKDISYENCRTVKSLEEAFKLVSDEEEVFIAGGAQLYSETINCADKIYLTIIHKHIDGNIFFPTVNESDFEKTYVQKVDGIIPYTYYTFKRKKFIK